MEELDFDKYFKRHKNGNIILDIGEENLVDWSIEPETAIQRIYRKLWDAQEPVLKLWRNLWKMGRING